MSKPLTIRTRTFDWGIRTYIMGVLNVTPDSFSDGGKFQTIEAAIAKSIEMVAAGVDIIDIGGESTKPGAIPVDTKTELERVIPVIRGIRLHPDTRYVPISIDTTKSTVAQAAIEAGADIINDVSGGNHDSQMLSTVSRLRVPYVMMHMRGTPMTMQRMTDYTDVVGEILDFFESQIQVAIAHGVDRSNIIIDPGIGFAKTYAQNIELIQHLDSFGKLDLPLLVGVSRKKFIGKILNQKLPERRVWGTAAACCAAIAGGADILRVHDVAEMVDVRRVADVLFRRG
jgi:dihydropteroate synthase